MDPNQKTEDTAYDLDVTEGANAEVSVDDFIRQLEAKEKDLHITAETTFIEIASEFDEAEVPDFMRPEVQKHARHVVKPAAQTAPDNSLMRKLEGEVKELTAKITSLKEERTELYKDSQRRLKDFEAYKARTERERSETFQRQLSNLATQMLPVLDNLDRALEFASAKPEEKENGFTQFFDGIVLVNQQVNEVLAGMGIDPIATVGEQFDPNFHEAVAIDETSDMPSNTITAELLRGFRIGNKVIRHSMVKVSKVAAALPAGTAQDTGFIAAKDEGEDADPPIGSKIELETPSENQSVEFELSSGVSTGEFEIERNGHVEPDDDEKV